MPEPADPSIRPNADPDRRISNTRIGIVVAIVAGPYLARLAHPSLYSDDILRVASLKTTPLLHLWVRPFNEHLAPLFDTVSWLAWGLAGHSLVAARWTFTVASILPFLLTLGAFGVYLRDETKSPSAVVAGVVLLGSSSTYAEVVAWYSASSFSWAALFSIMTLILARDGGCRGVLRGTRLALAALCACLAPMGSGLGLLAGPSGAVRVGVSRSKMTIGDRLFGMMAPLSGTAVFLALGLVARYQATLSGSVRDNSEWPIGLWHSLRAPWMVLVPGLFGVSGWSEAPSISTQAMILLAGWAILFAWAVRSRHRGAAFAAICLILGGYLLTYPLRVRKQSLDLLDYQRYHLFPQIGMSLIVACALRPAWRWIDERRFRGAVAIAALIFGSMAVHRAEIRSRLAFYRFPDQAGTFRAIERVESICRREGIGRDRAIGALEPIRARWFPHDFDALNLIGPTTPSPGGGGRGARETLIRGLSREDREGLFGSMDSSPYWTPRGPGAGPVAWGRPVGSTGMRPLGRPGRFEATGWPACLEYDLGPPTAGARSLVAAGVSFSGGAEVWWSDGRGGWSDGRSVRWRLDRADPGREWAIPLDRMPHLEAARARRLRIYFRTPGPVGFGRIGLSVDPGGAAGEGRAAPAPIRSSPSSSRS